MLQMLGFRVLPDRKAQSNMTGYSTAMLDFGPSSVDGWLARLVAAELGVEENGFLDCAARELVLKGGRVSLSKLEFGVMEYLQQHVGEAVPRIALLESVWEQSYDGGSNVVDVVIRALRKNSPTLPLLSKRFRASVTGSVENSECIHVRYFRRKAQL